MTPQTRVVSGPGQLGSLGEHVRSLGASRPFLITGPSRRFVDEARAGLGSAEITIFDEAAAHVPKRVVARASEALARSQADILVALGGGAAVGLGKALRLTHDLPFVAVPTTYAGSEMTQIWGITDGKTKRTGRDQRVVPQLVIHDPQLPGALPPTMAVQSLLNALAHPIGVLARAPASSGTWAAALSAIRTLVRGLVALLIDSRHVQARRWAMAGAAAAGRILDEGELGTQHQVAHVLGGRFAVSHAALHSVLLPAFVADLRRHKPAHYEAIAGATGQQDIVAVLHDALATVGAPTSLRQLEFAWSEARQALLAQGIDELELGWVHNAYLGRRCSARTRQSDWIPGAPPTTLAGPPLADARKVVIALHGRDSTADAVVQRVREIIGDAPDIAIVAPQAPDSSWYCRPYREAAGTTELGAALATTAAVLARVRADVPADRIIVFGFSQGACLALEAAALLDAPLGGVIALSGARIGGGEWVEASPHLAGVAVLVGVSSDDPWVSAQDVLRTADHLAGAGARVDNLGTTGDAHEITARQRISARAIILGSSPARFGFGNVFDVENLPGALPRAQNSPRRPPYGLSAEQLNGTGFMAPRAANHRSWLYRVRPPPGHRRYEAMAQRSLDSSFVGRPADPNLTALAPLPIPVVPTDFIDGMHTIGGAGDPKLRRGYAVHVYAANRSMEHRALYNADGDMVVLPQMGGLTLLTDMGSLRVRPGQLAIVPQGIRVSVLLESQFARGYVGETFGRHFQLPERGPVGANGLADARHFRAPTPYHENRLAPGFQVVAKLGGVLWKYTESHSPFDVAAWHGNYTPMTYDLAEFSPVSAVRIDHADPSLYSVLTAPLDEGGSNSLDLVIFPPRWDATEQTFRPPFFHRNAAMEFNGVVGSSESLPSDAMFQPGMSFLTQPMTAHGAVASVVDRQHALSDEAADVPHRTHGPLWFQFESALPMALTDWARTAPERIADWNERWGVYTCHYSPP